MRRTLLLAPLAERVPFPEFAGREPLAAWEPLLLCFALAPAEPFAVQRTPAAGLEPFGEWPLDEWPLAE